MDTGLTPPNLNAAAAEIADAMEEQAGLLRVRARRLDNGARVIDAGIEVEGGLRAGLALAEICMGGLGTVTYVPLQLGAETWPGVSVWTDHPAASPANRSMSSSAGPSTWRCRLLRRSCSKEN